MKTFKMKNQLKNQVLLLKSNQATKDISWNNRNQKIKQEINPLFKTQNRRAE